MRILLMAAIAASLSTPARAAVDTCLTGDWVAETSHLLEFFRTATPAPVSRVEGKVIMTVNADGTATATILDFEIEQPVGADQMINAGTGFFEFVINTSGEIFSLDITDLSVNVKATMYKTGAAPALLADVTQTLADTGPKSLNGNYTCSAGALTLVSSDPAENLFPNWRRP